MPRRSSPLHLATLALLISALGGCYYASGTIAGGAVLGAAIGAVSTPRPLPTATRYPAGASIVVDFLPPRVVASSLPGERDSLRVIGVTRVVGELRSSRGDTLWIAASQLRRRAGGPLSFAHRHEPVFVLPPEAPSRVQVVASNGQLVQRTLIGSIVGIALGFLLLYSLCYPGGCYYD